MYTSLRAGSLSGGIVELENDKKEYPDTAGGTGKMVVMS